MDTFWSSDGTDESCLGMAGALLAFVEVVPFAARIAHHLPFDYSGFFIIFIAKVLLILLYNVQKINIITDLIF